MSGLYSFRHAMSWAQKGGFGCARMGGVGGGRGKSGARVVKERRRPMERPSTGVGGTKPAPSPGEVPLTHCPQEELGGLLGGAGQEQPRLLQGAQGPGTRHLGELGAWRSWDLGDGGLPRQWEARGDSGDSGGGGYGDTRGQGTR